MKHWIEKKEEEFQELKSPDQFLLKMMELMIENDLLYLLHLEKEIEKMEDQLIKVFQIISLRFLQSIDRNYLSWMHIMNSWL